MDRVRQSVTTVTLNAAIDRHLDVSEVVPRTVMRAERAESTPGGKGLNVARTVRHLGAGVVATGFIAGHAGAFIEEGVRREGITAGFVRIPGESRSCINIIDAHGHSTEFLEPGPLVREENLEELRRVVHDHAQCSAVVVMSGSLPRGCPPTTYADLVTQVHEAGAQAFLDTSGQPLVRGLEAGPDFVKPNGDEIRELLGSQVHDPTSGAHAARDLAERFGIPMVVVSLGPQGAVGAFGGDMWWAPAPDIPVVNTVGCGDAFVGAFAACHAGDGDPVAALVAGVEISNAVAMSQTTGTYQDADLATVRSMEISARRIR